MRTIITLLIVFPLIVLIIGLVANDTNPAPASPPIVVDRDDLLDIPGEEHLRVKHRDIDAVGIIRCDAARISVMEFSDLGKTYIVFASDKGGIHVEVREEDPTREDK